MVTVAIKEVIFRTPVKVGEVVSFITSLVRVGNTSITVCVEVVSEQKDGPHTHVTAAEVVYVAVKKDSAGKLVKVPVNYSGHDL